MKHGTLPATMALVLVAACSRTGPTATPGTDAAAPTASAQAGAQVAAAPWQAAPEPEPAPTSFACEGGHRVDLGDLVAVVQLQDGRRLQLPRNPDDGSDFTGDGVRFRSSASGGTLTLGVATRSTCSAA